MGRKREQNMDGFGKSLKLNHIFAKVLRKKEDGKREPKTKRNVEKDGKEQRRSARLRGGKPEKDSLVTGEARSKRRRDKFEHIVDQGLKRRKKEKKRKEEVGEEPVQVFRIHVGAGGEEQLRQHLRGDRDTVMQVRFQYICSKQTNRTDKQTFEIGYKQSLQTKKHLNLDLNNHFRQTNI